MRILSISEGDSVVVDARISKNASVAFVLAKIDKVFGLASMSVLMIVSAKA